MRPQGIDGANLKRENNKTKINKIRNRGIRIKSELREEEGGKREREGGGEGESERGEGREGK
jgi:hypothetical protein